MHLDTRIGNYKRVKTEVRSLSRNTQNDLSIEAGSRNRAAKGLFSFLAD